MFPSPAARAITFAAACGQGPRVLVLALALGGEIKKILPSVRFSTAAPGSLLSCSKKKNGVGGSRSSKLEPTEAVALLLLLLLLVVLGEGRVGVERVLERVDADLALAQHGAEFLKTAGALKQRTR